MTNKISRRSPARTIVSIIASATSMVSIALVACADESDANPPRAPIDGTGASRSPICQDLAETRKSMEDAVTSVTKLDEIALDQATTEVRANLDSLAESARETGQKAQAEKLTASVVEFHRLLARPQVSWSDPAVRSQIRQIADELAAMENTAGCPA